MAEIIHDFFPDSKLLGVMRGLNGVSDAVSIVHGRSCCHSDSLLFNVLTTSNDDIKLLGSGIRSQDISTGGERKLSLAIRSAYREFKPKLIAILIASVPTLIGDDVDGTLAKMGKEIPCEICSFPCAGYEGYANDGYEEVLSGLVQYMVSPAKNKISNAVNLVGFKADDPHAAADLGEIKRMLDKQGIKINTILSASKFGEIKNAPGASLNVVLGGDGLGCARLMEEQLGIPYVIVPYPFGWRQSIEFLEKVAGALGRELNQKVIHKENEQVKKKLQKVYAYLQGIYGLPAAVVGEAGRCFNLAGFLSDEIGLKIKLLSVISKNPVLHEMEKENTYFEELFITPDHFRMEEVIKSKGVEVIFGSTVEKRLARELNIPLIRTAYPVLDAVSISDIPYAGFRGVINLVETIINAVISG